MHIVAPVVPLTGHGPLPHRGAGDVAGELVTLAHAGSPSVLQPSCPRRLSLKGLLQSENVQTIQQNLAILARFADHLPQDISASTPRVSNDELLIMGNLVRDISSSLEKIGSLREENEDEVLPDVANKYVPVRPMSFVERKRRREKMKMKLAHKCHSCSRLETPQWRPGPDGPRTLCNVCGLVYTKRQQRHADQVVRAPRHE